MRKGSRWFHLLLLAVGLAGALFLVLDSDEERILGLLVGMAPHLATIAGVHVLAIVAATAAWYVLLDRDAAGVTLPRLLVFRWIGDAVNQLLPVAQIGGEVVRTRLLVLASSVTATAATAATVVDLTAGFLALILYVGTGFILLALEGGLEGLPVALIVGVGALASLLGVAVLIQRGGAIQWLADRLPFASVKERVAAFQASLANVYDRGGDVALCVVFRFLAWLVGGAVIWLALGFLGAPVTFQEALIIDGIAQGVRNAGFFVPGGYGVQEGAYVVAGALVGVGPEAALALSLVKRIRDLLLGLPAFAAWHWAERRYART